MNNLFLSHSDVYTRDFSIIYHAPSQEYTGGLHYHDFYEIQIYFDDAGIFTINGNQQEIHAGDIVFISMFQSHEFKAHPGKFYRRVAFNLDPVFLLAACTPKANLLSFFEPQDSKPFVYHFDEEKFAIYRKFHEIYETNTLPYGRNIFERGLVYEILGTLYNDLHDELIEPSTHKATLQMIANILHYINSHLSEELTLDRLCQETSYSASYICTKFRQYTGTTVTHYINLKRIELAKQLLSQKHSAYEASIAAGFNNYSYFFRKFREITGISPKDYTSVLPNRGTT